MTDPYSLDNVPTPDRPRTPAGHRIARVVLWTVMLPTAAFNAASSFGGHTVASLGAGIVATGCIVGLIVSHVTGRRR
ncbi:hypothetical protein R8Z50_24325 [Longispora sp. K20-0274]|uniref:hypothetical protein n=1 Tax=Longispora sp. K20-0274 TaxID=3088255 RepID=UPI0039994D52